MSCIFTMPFPPPTESPQQPGSQGSKGSNLPCHCLASPFFSLDGGERGKGLESHRLEFESQFELAGRRWTGSCHFLSLSFLSDPWE